MFKISDHRFAETEATGAEGYERDGNSISAERIK